MHSPFLFVPLATPPRRWRWQGAVRGKCAFDPDDMYYAGAAPGQPFFEDGVHLR